MNHTDRTLAFKLLRENCSITDITCFLRERGIKPFSAQSWEELFSARIAPTLDSRELDRSDIFRILADGEEFGRQHVFLYTTSKNMGTQLTNENYVRPRLASIGREDLLDKAVFLDRPDDLRISQVRFEQARGRKCLVVKAVQGHEEREFVGEEKHDDFVYRKYRFTAIRAVNVARFWDDGRAELRLFSHRNASDYADDLQNFWNVLNFLVSQLRFELFSVGKAKRNIWDEIKRGRRGIKFKDARLLGASGNSISAATGSMSASLFDEPNAAASVEIFWNGDVTCEHSVVSWEKGAANNGDAPTPSKEINVRIAGAVNEFTITSTCLKRDYEYVLEEIWRTSR
jgi:hypothetical protein